MNVKITVPMKVTFVVHNANHELHALNRLQKALDTGSIRPVIETRPGLYENAMACEDREWDIPEITASMIEDMNGELTAEDRAKLIRAVEAQGLDRRLINRLSDVLYPEN